MQAEGRPVIELGRASRDRWLLYQASIGSPVYDILAARTEPKLVNYHNITPADLLRDWEPAVAYEVALGRTQLARLAPQSRFAVADSAFNESELQALGYEGTAVVPLLIDMHSKSDEPDPDLARALARAKERDGGADLLYVGKISPHKAPHDLVKMLDVLRRTDDPAARLHLVGSPLGETYEPALRAFIDELGLADVVTSPARSAAPSSRRTSGRPTSSSWPPTTRDSASPWPRPWATACPIVAYGVTAVPETVGGAGLVLDDKSAVPFAAAVGRVLRDETLRDVLAAAGRERAAGFDLAASTHRSSPWCSRPSAPERRSSGRPARRPGRRPGRRPRQVEGGDPAAGRGREGAGAGPPSPSTRATAPPARRGPWHRPAGRRRPPPRAGHRRGWPRPAARASWPRAPGPRSPRAAT